MQEAVVLGPAPAWSFSKLMKYEQCPAAILNGINKLPTPERDENNAGVRGNRVHDQAEKLVRREIDFFPHELKKFKPEMLELQQKYDDGVLILEEDWAFTIDWEPCEWKATNVWVRLKLDVYERIDAESARLIDYKTGKKFGNEVKHMQQAQLYAVGVFMKFPEINYITTEFWYLDHGLVTRKTYTRDKFLVYFNRFNQRGIRFTTEKEFLPKPSKQNCKWCDYGKENGTDSCPYAYEE